MTVENKRVYELAKEYGMSNKDFIEYLEQKLDLKVKSHSSNLSPAQIDKIKASFSKKTAFLFSFLDKQKIGGAKKSYDKILYRPTKKQERISFSFRHRGFCTKRSLFFSFLPIKRGKTSVPFRPFLLEKRSKIVL